jgi:hypothetical protein
MSLRGKPVQAQRCLTRTLRVVLAAEPEGRHVVDDWLVSVELALVDQCREQDMNG